MLGAYRSVLSVPGSRRMLASALVGRLPQGMSSLAASHPASGLLLALWSVGSMTGGLWYGSRTWRSPLEVRYRVLLVLAVVCTVPLIAARSIPVGIVCSLLAGLTIAPVFSCQYALVGRAVNRGSQTEAFTWVTAALVAGIAVGAAAGGAVISSEGVGAPFVLSCLATTVAALLAGGLRSHVEQPA
jgi:predicted MFS family arabinose efflux permease